MALVSERMRCDLQDGLPAISSMRKRLEIALDVAKALQYLHAEDLIHRDVKVQNVLVSGRVVIPIFPSPANQVPSTLSFSSFL